MSQDTKPGHPPSVSELKDTALRHSVNPSKLDRNEAQEKLRQQIAIWKKTPTS